MNRHGHDLDRAAATLASAAHLVVFTGSGVSKESGLATFRDVDGAWAQYDPMDYASPQGFRRNPQGVWEWYAQRRQQMLEVEPNPAHLAIAALENLIAEVTVITQNIDGLHQRAGSSRVLELHGNIHRYKCSRHCRGEPTYLPTPDPFEETLQPCPYCGAHARPDVVWFGESLPPDVWEAAAFAAMTCDAMLVVGTSGAVEPAASLPRYARQHRAFIVEVNPETTPITQIAGAALRGPAGEWMPALLEAVRDIHDAQA
ncbi:MAG: NAD-dependent deacylase [Anaerolineae bacterium]|nr:NAD-dependent deacylase [Anaerolineae bacterium]